MQRRALLASLAVGASTVAGCFSGQDSPQSDDTPSDERETDPADPGSQPDDPFDERTRVVELETGPRTYAFDSTGLRTDDGGKVRLQFDRTATPDHPARLHGSLENTNDFENTFRVEWIPAVGRVHSRTPREYTHEARLHLAPTENNDLAETVPEVVRDDSGYWRVEDLGPWVQETVRLAPGERAELESVLVGEPGMPGRPPVTYEFRGRDRTVSVATWNTKAPGPTEESAFQGRSVPPIHQEGSIQWYHEADRATQAFVRTSAEQVELDGLIEFEMVNHSHELLLCGHWNLYKLVDGEWFHVAPTIHTSDCRGLAPGASKTWSLRAFNGEAVGCGDCGCNSGLTQGYLGGGEYAVVAGYGHPADESGALVELVGDPATLALTDDATADREGDTVTVTTDRDGDDEHPPDATFALTRANTAAQRVVAEQVMASDGFAASGRGLRNLLAAVESDVAQVVLQTNERALREPDSAGATKRVRFRGQAYEITRQ